MVGTFDYRQVPRTPSWTWLLLGYQLHCITMGLGGQRWQPLFLKGSMGILYSHVQDIVAKLENVTKYWSIFILSIPFRSINLHYCFRKLDPYSVQLHDARV